MHDTLFTFLSIFDPEIENSLSIFEPVVQNEYAYKKTCKSRKKFGKRGVII